MRTWAVVVVAVNMLACGGNGGSGPDGAGTPDGFSGTPTVADVALACVRASACGWGQPSYCFREDGLVNEPEAVACALAAGLDCDVMPTCFGWQPVEDPACESRCDGDTLAICYQGRRLERDCSAEGSTCIVSSGPLCSAGACDEAANPPACVGTAVRECSDNLGFFVAFDCARYGWTCTEADGEARCDDGTAAPPTCSGEGKRCDGGDLVWCSGGHEVRQRCADYVSDGTCQDWGGMLGCGAAATCNPNADDSGTCSSGTTLSMCAGGVMQTYDCIALGYRACVDDRCAP